MWAGSRFVMPGVGEGRLYHAGFLTHACLRTLVRFLSFTVKLYYGWLKVIGVDVISPSSNTK
jgi:hypothetical protein